MKVLIKPTAVILQNALIRPRIETEDLEAVISKIFNEIQLSGDIAVQKFSQQFDQSTLEDFLVTEAEFEAAEKTISPELKNAIQIAANNIELFHKTQQTTENEVETTAGVRCWRKSVPIQKVGLYIPGGTAPLFSTVLMLGIPAKIAGCSLKIMCTPPNKLGQIHPAILVAAKIAGIQTIFKVGGAQAIAAMTIGTKQIPQVDKLFGPGNQYVTAAKQFAQRNGVAIDMPAGPSEVLVAADDSIPPAFVAADLLAQAEHGVDSQVVFITDSEEYVAQVKFQIQTQLLQLPRAETAKSALALSVAIVVPVEKWVDIINEYAPEHLIVMGKNEQLIVDQVVNAGSVFVGEYTAESFGDYASGTNHTLPTAGFARSYSGVSLDSFVKKITYQQISKIGLENLGNVVITMAEAEELQAHANAIKVRLESIQAF